jgi:UDP-glucose 4-epimerase
MSEAALISGERVLVTGGAGFIGTSLTRRLLADNEVVVFDNFHRNAIESSGLLGSPRLTVIRGDVLDAEAVSRSLDGVTMVVHLAAIAGVDTVLQRPSQTMKVNIIGT